MCGRFVTVFSLPDLLNEVEKLLSELLVEVALPRSENTLFENYNVAPTHAVPVVTFEEERVVIDVMQWGLVPSWSKDPSVGSKMINARSETLSEKPSFRNLIRSNRGLVPMNGFYEWNRSDPQKKIPFFVPREDSRLLWCAALWTTSTVLDNTKTFTLITKASGKDLADIHHRSPVQFDDVDSRSWLTDTASALPLLQSDNQPAFGAYRVSSLVNSVKNNNKLLLVEDGVDTKDHDTLF